MRISLTETKQIEDWLLNKIDVQNRLVMEAKMITDETLREKSTWQSAAYEYIQSYGQEKLRQEIKLVENDLFRESKFKSFQSQIRSIFK